MYTDKVIDGGDLNFRKKILAFFKYIVGHIPTNNINIDI